MLDYSSLYDNYLCNGGIKSAYIDVLIIYIIETSKILYS